MSDTNTQAGEARPLTAEEQAWIDARGAERIMMRDWLCAQSEQEIAAIPPCDMVEAIIALAEARGRERDRALALREQAESDNIAIILKGKEDIKELQDAVTSACGERNEARRIGKMLATALLEDEHDESFSTSKDSLKMLQFKDGDELRYVTAGEVRAALGITETIHERIERDGTL